MAKTRLTDSDRRKIRDCLLEDTFADRVAARRRQRNALATQALIHHFGADCFERFSALPEGWLPSVNTVYVEPKDQAHTKRVDLQLDEYRPLPSSVSYGSPIPLDTKLSRGVVKWMADGEQLNSERSTLSIIIFNALRAFTTQEALAEKWPEAAAKLNSNQRAATPHQLPAVSVDDVRVRLAAAKKGKVVPLVDPDDVGAVA